MADDKPLTYTCCMGDQKDRPLTPIAIAPDMLVDNIYRSGSRLVIMGDCDHVDPAVEKFAVLMLGSQKALPATDKAHLPMFLDERVKGNEEIYTRFAKATTTEGEREFKEYLLDPDDGNAPPEKYADARKAYFDAKLGTFEMLKKRGIRTRFIDDRDEDLQGKVDWKATEIRTHITNFEVVAAMRDGDKDFEKTPMSDISKLSDEEFAKRHKKMLENHDNAFMHERNPDGTVERIALIPLALQEGETMADKKAQLARVQQAVMKEFGAAMDETGAAVQTKGNARITQLQKQQHKLETTRDIWRDGQMDANAAAALQEDKDARALLMVGAKHLRKEDKERTEPNLQERLQARGLNPKRIDVMPVDAGILAKLPNHTKLGDMDCVVCIGGHEGADYTVLVPATRFEPGKVAGYEMKMEKEQPTETGPHKDKLKAQELNTLSISRLPVLPVIEEDHLGALTSPQPFRQGRAATPSGTKIFQL